MVDLKLEILSIKNLKKLSHRALEAVHIVLTVGITTELITENKTLGLHCKKKIRKIYGKKTASVVAGILP